MSKPGAKPNPIERRASLTTAFSKASQMLTGQGPPLHKQLKLAITEGNEDKAILIYQSKEGGKSLMSTLQPSKPFPSKKNKDDDTPLHLTAKYALLKLFHMFLEYGGNPAVHNSRLETCAHVACTMQSNPAKRAEIVEAILQWRGVREDNTVESVSIDESDVDGNSAIHLAAYNGLLYCVDKLVYHGANLSLLNHSNLTCAEYADIGGRAAFGTMLELACVFRAVDDYQQASHAFHSYQQRPIAPIILNSDSMTLPSLMKFISQAIAFISDTTGENAARAEVLLSLFAWEAGRCKKEYLQDTSRVLAEAGLVPKIPSSTSSTGPSHTSAGDYTSNASVSSRESKFKDNGAVSGAAGVSIEDVFLDPALHDQEPFVVFRDGKRFTYNIRTYNGKTGVYPTDYDPAAKRFFNDQIVSASSHIKPAYTEPCAICGERMHEPASVQHFISGALVEPKHRELHCNSGHKYCFNCWSDHLQAHVMRDHSSGGGGCLPCPGFKCGEILDLQWAPVMLKSPDLVNRLYAQRQRQVIDCVGLRWCPVPKCGLLVHVPNVTYFGGTVNSRGNSIASSPGGRGGNNNINNGALANEGANAGNVPQVAVCANGHGFCLSCNQEAHSPCSCNDLARWVELVREESRYADPRDQKNVMNILLVPPNHKPCPECSADNGKESGGNHIRCLSCRHEFCWQCLQPWMHHRPDSGGFFYCNRYVDDRGLLSSDGSSGGGGVMRVPYDEDDGLKSASTKKQRAQRAVTFLHHFSRYQGHRECMRMESSAGKQALERISQGLRASKEGELLWLLGEDALNPYDESQSQDMFSHINDLNVRNVKDTIITNYYIPREKSVEFLLEAFEELERARLLLRWSYPFALFEFNDQFARGAAQSKKRPAGEFRANFEAAQSALEVFTEALSDLIACKRVRGTKSQIVETVQSARLKRSELEHLIVQHSVAHPPQQQQQQGDMRPISMMPVGHHTTSSSSSLTSSSLSERNSPANKRGGNANGFASGDLDMEAVLSKLGKQQSAVGLARNNSSGPVTSSGKNIASSGYAAVTESGGMLQRQYSDYPMDGDGSLPSQSQSQAMRDYKEDDDSEEDVGPYVASPVASKRKQLPFSGGGSIGSNSGRPSLQRRPSSYLRAMEKEQTQLHQSKDTSAPPQQQQQRRQKDPVTKHPPFLASRTVSSDNSGVDDVMYKEVRKTGSGNLLHVAVAESYASRSMSGDLLDSPRYEGEEDEDDMEEGDNQQQQYRQYQYQQQQEQRQRQFPADETKGTAATRATAGGSGGMVVVSKGGKRFNVRGNKQQEQDAISEQRRIDQSILVGSESSYHHDNTRSGGGGKAAAPTKTTFRVGGSLTEVLSDSIENRQALARGLRKNQQDTRHSAVYEEEERDEDDEPAHVTRAPVAPVMPPPSPQRPPDRGPVSPVARRPSPQQQPQSPQVSRNASAESGDHRHRVEHRVEAAAVAAKAASRDSSHESPVKMSPLAKLPLAAAAEESLEASAAPPRRGPRMEYLPQQSQQWQSQHHHHGGSLSLLKKASSILFEKHLLVHIEDDEAEEIRQMMSQLRLSKDEAVRKFFDDHDDKLYNPKAAYLFPGEVYVPPSNIDDDEGDEEEELFGHVEYHHRSNSSFQDDDQMDAHYVDDPEEEEEDDEASFISSPVVAVEQRFIGLKKDPDQEALEHAMLLSKQEAEFGANMYDSLTMDDQEVLDEYIAQGFTREEGALIIFEEKYGKCSDEKDNNVTPAMPTLHAIRASHLQQHPSAHSFGSDPDGGDDGMEDDPEVEHLISKGYTREQAITALSQRGSSGPSLMQRAASRRKPIATQDVNIHDLTEEEDMEMEGFMTRGGYTPEEALEMVLKDRLEKKEREKKKRSKEAAARATAAATAAAAAAAIAASSAPTSVAAMSETSSSTVREAPTPAAVVTPVPASTMEPQEAAVIRYMDMGYTRDQAEALVRHDTPAQQSTSATAAYSSLSNTGASAASVSASQYSSGFGISPTASMDGPSLRVTSPATATAALAQQESSPALPGSYHVPGIRRSSAAADASSASVVASLVEPTAIPTSQSGDADAAMAMAMVEDPEIMRYMDVGYTIEQAQQMLRTSNVDTSRESFGVDYDEYAMEAEDAAYPRNSNASVGSYGNSYAGDPMYQSGPGAGYRGPSMHSSAASMHSGAGYSQQQHHHQPRHYHHHQQPPQQHRREADSAELQAILAQQEREHGMNMFDAFTPQDEPEIDRLMGGGYTYHEALQTIFEYRYPSQSQHSSSYNYQQQPQISPRPYAAPRYGFDAPGYQQQDQYDQYDQPQYPGGGGSGPPVLLGRQHSLLQQRRMQGIDPRISSVQRQASYRMQPEPLNHNGSQGSLTNPYPHPQSNDVARSSMGSSNGGHDLDPNGSGRKKKKSMLRASSILGFSVGRRVAHTEGDVYMRAAELSRLEQEHGQPRDGVHSRQGVNKKRVPRMKFKERDVEQLSHMGFNREQAVQALIENKNDVGAAADALLSMTGR